MNNPMRLVIALLVLLVLGALLDHSGPARLVVACFTAADRVGYGLAALVLVAAGVYVHRALTGVVTPRRAAVPA